MQTTQVCRCIHLVLSILLVLYCKTTSGRNVAPNIELGVRDFCIIGGGAGGMSTAAFLKDKGHNNILVLERDNVIGGACNTYRFFNEQTQQPQTIDPGVVMFPNTTYAASQGCNTWEIDSVGFIERFTNKAPILPEPLSAAGALVYGADFLRGINLGQLASPPPNPAEIEAFQRLFTLIVTKYPWADTADYPDPLPAELLIPFDQWVIDNNFTALNSRWNGLVYDGGYGPLHAVTALYPIVNSACSSLLYGSDPKAWVYLPGGCIQIYEGIRNYIGADKVWENVNIQHAFRPLPGEHLPTVLIGTHNQESFVELCQNVIVSIAPSANNMAFMQPDATEQALYNTVQSRMYFAGVANLTGPLPSSNPPAFTLANVDVTQPGGLPQPPFVIGFERYAPSNGPTGFQGFSSVDITTAQALTITQSQVANIPPTVVNSTQILYIESHDFQPHFTIDALLQTPSPYTKLENLQGYRNTYYMGGINAFSNSVMIWNRSKQFVQKHF